MSDLRFKINREGKTDSIRHSSFVLHLFSLFSKLLFIVLINLPTTIFLLAAPVQAASASLFLSPSSGTQNVGNKFSVLIYVSTSQASNTYDVYLGVSNLTVTGLSVGGSICILYPSPPSYSPTSAHFQCGLPTPGFKGSVGYIGAITVKGNSPGIAKVFVGSNSKVLANDGAGTNILGSRGTATFTIQPPPTAAPQITSSTHPNQDRWYKEKTAKLSWSGSGTQFSYSLDHKSSTTPDQVSEGSGKEKTYEGLADGVWYFHVRVKGSSQWSGTTHYRLQIDSTPPRAFSPEADPKKDAETRPIIAFSTTDATSGVDHYELRLDAGDWIKVKNPYKIPSIASGAHTVFVKALDQAGNERTGSVDLSVKDIPAPKIEQPAGGSIIPYANSLFIKGHSFPGYQVKIFLDGVEIASVKADSTGQFEFTYKELLRAGKHEIYALATNPDNINSPKSEVINFEMDPRAYIIFGLTIPSWLLLVLFIVLILLLLLVTFFILFRFALFRRKLKELLVELEEKVEKDLSAEKVNKKTLSKVEKEFEEAEEELD
ncbi:MAG: hypothetical protein Q8P13_01390 [bacterium]|nr:hypothetical protein [bacterium]